MTIIKKPWHSEYKLMGIPETFSPYSEEPVYHILELAAKKYKNNGIIQYDYKMTYPELKESVDKLASALYKMGLRKGDRVLTILPTSIQFIISDYAISRIGLIQIPCSFLEPVDNLMHKFKEGKPKAVICLAKYADLILPIVKKLKITNLIFTKLEDYSSDKFDVTEYENISNVKEAVWMSDLVSNTQVELPEIQFDVVNDLETLLFTGGTTGLPKGCMLTHRNIYANSIQTLYSLGQAGLLLRGRISVILALPFFHSYGHLIMHSMMLFGFNQILVPEPRDTDGIIKMVEEHRPILQIGVPAQFMKISEKLKNYAMIGISGSAPLPPSTQKKYEEKSNGGIMEGYGLSEMSPTTHLNTSILLRMFGGRIPVRVTNIALRIPGSKLMINSFLRLLGTKNTGKLIITLFGILMKLSKKNNSDDKKKKEKRGTIGIPHPDTGIKILDIDSGKEISWEDMLAGRTGELLLNGPQRMLGYWPDTGSGIDDDGYIHTGDVIKIDENGYFYIVDRIKDMIIVSGYKVYSKEIDDILYNHPKIEMAATIGIPDPNNEGSEKIIVFIQAKEKYRNQISEKEIIDHLKTKVAKYSVPKVINILDVIPLTELEKVDKKLLREIAKKNKEN